jgi:uncharacterized protein YdgA (DUF945 family)
MKKLLGFLCLIVILVLGSLYGMGILTERTLQKNVAEVNASSAIVLNIKKYERGLYQSSAVVDMKFKIPGYSFVDDNSNEVSVPGRYYDISLPLNIEHGPVLFEHRPMLFGFGLIESHVVIPDEYTQKFNITYDALAKKPELDLSLFVDFYNKNKLHVSIPEFALTSKSVVNEMKWLGLESDLRFNADFDSLSGGLNLRGAHWQRSGFNYAIEGVSSDYDLHRDKATKLYLGVFNVAVPSFSLKDDKNSIFDIEQLKITSKSDIEQELFNSSVTLGFNKMMMHDKIFGSSFVKIAARNLDSVVFARINKQISSIGNDSQVSMRNQVLFTIIPQLPDLLNKGAELEITDLRFATTNGVVNGNLLISLEKNAANNPFELVKNLQGKGHIDISKSLFKDYIISSIKRKIEFEKAQNLDLTSSNSSPSESGVEPANVVSAAPNSVDDVQIGKQADDKVAAFIQSNTIVSSGDEYVIDITFNKGQLNVNGKPFTSAML